MEVFFDKFFSADVSLEAKSLEIIVPWETLCEVHRCQKFHCFARQLVLGSSKLCFVHNTPRAIKRNSFF